MIHKLGNSKTELHLDRLVKQAEKLVQRDDSLGLYPDKFDFVENLLKPCPFCGSDNIFIRVWGPMPVVPPDWEDKKDCIYTLQKLTRHRAFCVSCEADVDLEVWNKRV